MIEIEGIPGSSEILDGLAEEGKPVILNFSRGKDSVAVWNELAKRQIEVVPIHKSAVPGLNFIKKDLERYEDHFQTRIIDLPSDGFYRRLANNIFQPPERCAIIEAARLFVPTREEWDAIVRGSYAEPDTWMLDGVRATDSATRRMAIKRYGPVKAGKHRMSPIWDFGIRDVMDNIEAGGIKLGIDYEWWPRSFDGIRLDFMAKIREEAPEDYEIIKFWFPFIEFEVMRGGWNG